MNPSSERPAHARAFVDANYRFMAGYQEVNARIHQRQQVLALYVTLVVQPAPVPG